jgi:cell wall-associated NlpC family hydrolase
MSHFPHDTHSPAATPEGSGHKGRRLAPCILLIALGLVGAPALERHVIQSTQDAGPGALVSGIHSPDIAAGNIALDTVARLASNGAVPVPAATPETTGMTTDDYVNMRTGPGTTYQITAQLPADTELDVLGQQAGWYHVTTAWDTSGWIVADYLKIVPDEASDLASSQPERLGSAGVIDGPLNLRAGPGTGYASYGMLAEDTVLDVLALQGDWYKVRSPRDTVGWVAAESVALDWVPAAYTGGATTNATSSDVVRIAQKYLGARYVWGGDGPTVFDCSGLTSYVYGQVGVWLPRVSHDQFSTDYGRVISSMSGLAPGDLVFFERTTAASGITHVGIYAGGGRMIAARTERLGVRYVGLYEPFWNSRFVGGLRPYR